MNVDIEGDEFGDGSGKFLDLSSGTSVLDCNVLALDIAAFA
jgi:hypothetical protein